MPGPASSPVLVSRLGVSRLGGQQAGRRECGSHEERARLRGRADKPLLPLISKLDFKKL